MTFPAKHTLCFCAFWKSFFYFTLILCCRMLIIIYFECKNKNRFLDSLYICIKQNIKIFSLSIHTLNRPLAVTTTLALLGNDVTCTACLQRSCVGFRSRNWLGQQKSLAEFFWSHCCVFLATYCGLLSCWNVNFCACQRISAPQTQLLRIALCFSTSFLWFRLVSKSLLQKKNIPTALCLTVGIVLMRWCSLLGFLHTNQRILLLMVCKLFRCLLANSQWAVICILVTNGFCLATLPWRPDRGCAAPVVVLL